MGFGLPKAMGEKWVSGRARGCLAGDGSLTMNVQERATCVNEQIPVRCS